MVLGEQHPWSVSPRQAIEIQQQLATRVVQRWTGSPVRLVAGADCVYSGDDSLCCSAVVVWDLVSQAVVETATVWIEVRFPYLPGLFAFREAPAVLKTLERLDSLPELLICDGHGIAHPRRLGFASHVGVLAGIPTIGCAKKELCGTFADPDTSRGSSSPLLDRDEIIGTVLRTRGGVRPVFVSVGHLIDLPTAERIILACTSRYRLPEPLRLAHRYAEQALEQGPADSG